MTTHLLIHQEIISVTKKLIEINLSIHQNFPSLITKNNNCHEIAYSGVKDLSIALKNINYKEIYDELDTGKNYNVKMIDGALIQLLYTYQSSELISHRLAFFPSPSLEAFQNESKIYEIDEIYADIIGKNILPVPIRFDYSPNTYKEIDHPRCHLTLGQFKNCRIPVSSPITPYIFISFILRNFYNTAFKKFADTLTFSNSFFNETITIAEKKILHMAIDS